MQIIRNFYQVFFRKPLTTPPHCDIVYTVKQLELPDMTKVLWFSRHEMTPDQRGALEAKLGVVEILQVDGTMPNVHVPFSGKLNGEDAEIPPFKELMKGGFQVVAIVAPINLQQQIMGVAGETPVIFAESKRERISVPEGQDPQFQFIFKGWKRLVEVKVVTEDF
jgi:hypothetical protein